MGMFDAAAQALMHSSGPRRCSGRPDRNRELPARGLDPLGRAIRAPEPVCEPGSRRGPGLSGPLVLRRILVLTPADQWLDDPEGFVEARPF